MNEIPILDLQEDIQNHWESYLTGFGEVLKSGQFINGPNVAALESETAAYLGAKHCIGVNSGTDALVIALRALNTEPGDEVLVPSFSFFATAEAVSIIGAKPVFLDITEEDFNLDPEDIEKKITSKTKAIIPVHLFGQPAQMDRIKALSKKFNLAIVEDAAQAFGSSIEKQKVGTFGEMAAFSFFPSKNLGAFGDGGLISTNSDDLAEIAKKLKSHGSAKKYHNEMIGYNSRLDELQAVILRQKLSRIDEANEKRRRAAMRYDELLGSLSGVTTPSRKNNSLHIFHQYTVRIQGEKRDEVAKRLSDAGIQTMIYYPIPIHQLPVYQAESSVSLPITERVASEVLSLPIWPEISIEIQEKVSSELSKCL